MPQDAVGELLGNMAGAGGRMRPQEAGRRARIMQSRGTRVLGEGPTSAVAAGPTVPSTQHRSSHTLLCLHSVGTKLCCMLQVCSWCRVPFTSL